MVNALLWLVAVAVFGALNATYDPELGLAVAITVALGGITTTAFAYLLSERVLRAATARAMMARPPKRPVVPGVAARTVIAWSLGTAVPLLGLVIVAIYTVTGEDIDRGELARTVIALGGIALVFGLFAIILASRAVADPITSVRQAINEVEGGDFDVEVPVYDASELGLLQAGFNRMVGGLRERERIREAFGTYVDRDVAEHILEEGGAEGQEVDVTLLFLDVRDFTGFAERAPAREVVATLNRMFEIAVPVIREHGGHVDKFVGDGLLAVFGAPRRADDHAEQAMKVAIESVRQDREGTEGRTRDRDRGQLRHGRRRLDRRSGPPRVQRDRRRGQRGSTDRGRNPRDGRHDPDQRGDKEPARRHLRAASRAPTSS